MKIQDSARKAEPHNKAKLLAIEMEINVITSIKGIFHQIVHPAYQVLETAITY
jgi:hypothetical protein